VGVDPAAPERREHRRTAQERDLAFGGAAAQEYRNAAELSLELTKATAEPVKVNAIVALPGWYVERKGRSEVNVLNPSEIRQAVITNDKPQLSPAQIQRIADHLEQKCRDVVL